MDINSFIDEIKKRKDFKDVVCHEILSPHKAVYSDTASPLDNTVKKALEKLGVPSLYSHQADGIDLVREGKNTVVMTPTASGKSLIYNIPVVEALLKDPASHALYLFPLKGLGQDQQKNFNRFLEALELKKTGLSHCEIYDGDTSDYKRRKIREAPPGVILTNPDMLHLSINAFHQKWERFLSGLKYVVIDEIHTYRGVFGSHVAHVLKRFQRILESYGSKPVFIACSATIANPVELASMLTGKDFELVSHNGAPQGRRNFIFINPPKDGQSPYTIATKLFTESVRSGFKTIAFTKARKVTELMHLWVKKGAPDIAQAISSYRAGLLPEERRDVERRLFSGELNGVISTSALELGVDIGGLDVCILTGYPGTISSTRQRSGRVGRSGQDSLIIMVGLNDALDQYFMRSPQEFFKRPPEAAVLDSSNRPITKAHLQCAAAEAYLKPDDAFYDVDELKPVLQELETEGKLRHWEKGGIWYPRKRFPHREVSIRGIGKNFKILDKTKRVMGESDASRVLKELYPGAIYMHRGAEWRVESLDMGLCEVICRPADGANYYTRPITNEEVEIISVDAAIDIDGVNVNLGMIRVTESVLGYRKKETRTNRLIGEFMLNLPPSVFTTSGVWMGVEDGILAGIRKMDFDDDGALHALEHAMIASLPLFALCDRMDLGGRSYPYFHELGQAAIFVYDGHEGGVGLARRGFECVKDWLTATQTLMDECPCEVSCPSCTQDPNCGNNNDPLDKRGALFILKNWLPE